MKKSILILFLFICGVAAAQNVDTEKEKKPEPKITFKETEHDFGTVAENAGRKVSHDYVFTNTGDCPLVITRIITSCKCVSTSYTKKPIPPGGQGVVTVTYDPKKQQGVFYKAVQVFSNAPEGLHIIIAKGQVKTRKESRLEK